MLLDSLASLDRKEKPAPQDSRVPVVFLVALVPRETLVCLVFLDSPGRRETLDFLAVVAFLEIQETLEHLVCLVNPAYLQHRSW